MNDSGASRSHITSISNSCKEARAAVVALGLDYYLLSPDQTNWYEKAIGTIKNYINVDLDTVWLTENGTSLSLPRDIQWICGKSHMVPLVELHDEVWAGKCGLASLGGLKGPRRLAINYPTWWGIDIYPNTMDLFRETGAQDVLLIVGNFEPCQRSSNVVFVAPGRRLVLTRNTFPRPESIEEWNARSSMTWSELERQTVKGMQDYKDARAKSVQRYLRRWQASGLENAAEQDLILIPKWGISRHTIIQPINCALEAQSPHHTHLKASATNGSLPSKGGSHEPSHLPQVKHKACATSMMQLSSTKNATKGDDPPNATHQHASSGSFQSDNTGLRELVTQLQAGNTDLQQSVSQLQLDKKGLNDSTSTLRAGNTSLSKELRITNSNLTSFQYNYGVRFPQFARLPQEIRHSDDICLVVMSRISIEYPCWLQLEGEQYVNFEVLVRFGVQELMLNVRDFGKLRRKQNVIFIDPSQLPVFTSDAMTDDEKEILLSHPSQLT
ncbi:hypothetical protein G7Y89_g9158 [Cudoniella acicularis]|uniref:Uncharacterized protein n=1 Tax=Cudoniella acicularis TaxID=354080 RepID=A0A8H4RHH5_9HELO|nr:hypothetical protein G7Y89_g9158 [Cudoniella acicularis]